MRGLTADGRWGIRPVPHRAAPRRLVTRVVINEIFYERKRRSGAVDRAAQSRGARGMSLWKITTVSATNSFRTPAIPAGLRRHRVGPAAFAARIPRDRVRPVQRLAQRNGSCSRCAMRTTMVADQLATPTAALSKWADGAARAWNCAIPMPTMARRSLDSSDESGASSGTRDYSAPPRTPRAASDEPARVRVACLRTAVLDRRHQRQNVTLGTSSDSEWHVRRGTAAACDHRHHIGSVGDDPTAPGTK